MRTVRAGALFVFLSICQMGRLQSQETLQILQATYGVDATQIDVTQQVQALVQRGQSNVRVGNHLFGRDPMFGKTKTLSVFFAVNGIQYRSNIREGEPLVLTQPSNQSVAISQTATAQVPATPRLAPDGVYFLTGSTSVIKDGALIGLHAGTSIQFLRDDGRTVHARWEDAELDVDKSIITNDLNVAQAAVANDQQAQAVVGQWMRQQQDAINQQADAKQKVFEESARQMEKPRGAFGSWSNSQSNPLNQRPIKPIQLPTGPRGVYSSSTSSKTSASSSTSGGSTHSSGSLTTEENARRMRAEYLQRDIQSLQSVVHDPALRRSGIIDLSSKQKELERDQSELNRLLIQQH
jgi:hypothetical protein